MLTDANNYHYSAEMQIDLQSAAPLSDVVLDWSTFTSDLFGDPIDPITDVDSVRLIAFENLSPTDIEAGLSGDALDQSDVSAFFTCEPGDDTSCLLSEFGILGSTPGVDQYFTVGRAYWLATLETDGRQGTRALLLFEADPDATGTQVTFVSGASTLSPDVSLTADEPLTLSADPAMVLDWGSLTTDGHGNAIAMNRVDRLQIGAYDVSPDALEQDFLHLDARATETWAADVSGVTQLGLDALTGDRPFPGVDASATWVLALQCSTCDNPVPPFLTVLHPTD